MNVTTSSIKKCDLRKETSQELNGDTKKNIIDYVEYVQILQ